MPRRVNELTDISIDEVSLVDRPANQHAVVAIAKRAEEEDMPDDEGIEIFDQEGNPVDADSLQEGDIVYTGDGLAYEAVALDEDESEADEAEVEEPELVEVGKSVGQAAAGLKGGFRTGLNVPKANTAFKTGAHFGRNKGKYAAGAAGFAAGAGGATVLNKSFADEVREELSKAATDRDRDEIISKALEAVEEANKATDEAWQIAKSERDLRLTREYTEVAKGYNVPVDENELGPVLMRMAETMDDADCAIIHKALSAAGEALYAEVGFVGGADNKDVYSAVSEIVAKGDSGVTAEAISKFFDENPSAYDDYLAEN
jgi:hypothetical protein